MIKILLADDHPLIRAGLKAIIEKQKDMQVVAEAENGRDAVALARKLRPTVIIMDISMPQLNGIDAARQVRELGMKTGIIALSVHTDKRIVRQMFSAGATGFLLKECAFNEVTEAINAVAAGHGYVSAKVAGVVIDDAVEMYGRQNDLLTAREREILQMIAEGKSTKEIALELGNSVKTIEVHRTNIMQKLDLHTVADLTKYAIREGLTKL